MTAIPVIAGYALREALRRKVFAVVRPRDDKAPLVDKSFQILLGHLLAMEAERRMDGPPALAK